MRRESYPTDLSEAEWGILQPLVPPPLSGGRRRDVDMREILNAALYRQRGGCSWRLLPYEFPPWQTVYTYVRKWQQDGTWQRMLAALEGQASRSAYDPAGDRTMIQIPTAAPGGSDAVVAQPPMRRAG